MHRKNGTEKKGGIQYLAKIKHIQLQQNDGYVHLELNPWEKLHHRIRPVGYGVQTYTITTTSLLKEVQEILELFMKSKEERILWKRCAFLRSKLRVSGIVVIWMRLLLLRAIMLQGIQVWVGYENEVLVVGRGSMLFREVLEMLNVRE